MGDLASAYWVQFGLTDDPNGSVATLKSKAAECQSYELGFNSKHTNNEAVQ
jgi:hypothetical protein